MWSSDRRTLLVLLLAGAPLTACGFVPAYGPKGAAAGLQGQIRVDDPSDKRGFDLVRRLEERLGRTSAPKYGLGYTITTRQIGAAITPDNTTTRYNVTGDVAYVLRDLATGAVLSKGTVNNFTSYSATGTTVSSLTAETDASERLMRSLADQIVTRLIATSGTWAR